MRETLFSHGHLRSYVFHFPLNASPAHRTRFPYTTYPPCQSLNPLVSLNFHIPIFSIYLIHCSNSFHHQTIAKPSLAPPPKPPAPSITTANPFSIIKPLEAVKVAITMHQVCCHGQFRRRKRSFARDSNTVAAVRDIVGASRNLLRGCASGVYNQLVP